MRRASPIFAVLAIAALSLPLGGCNAAPVKILIPDFESAQVEGVTFWRMRKGGDFVEDGRIVFERTTVQGDQEFVDYRVEEAGGFAVAQARTRLFRSADDPDVVGINLHYVRRASKPRMFKLSAFNAAGDSDLTLESTRL